jgi:hypothetical protein
MANTIRHKRGTTTPLASNLVTGEIAINTSTGAAFTKTDAGSVVQIGGSGGGTWGSITGTLSSQTDLNTALGLKASLASPALTGNVTITTNSSSPALIIVQDGAGDIIQFKDVTSDSTFSFIDQNGKVTTIAPTTSNAGFNLPHGTAPTSPVNGDMWTTTGGVGVRINGVNQTLASTSSLSFYATIASPTFTGVPAAPTATAGTSTTQLATTAFVTTADNLKANLASPTFTGVPAAPLAATGTDTTQLATTSFVQQELAAGTAISKSVVATVRNETGATLTKGTVVYISGAGGNKALVSKAQADTEANSSGTYGLVQADIANNNNGTVVIAGIITGLNTNAYADGDKIYLSPTVAGGWTTTKPSAPDHMVFLGTITYAHANQGAIQLRISNGFELSELHDVSIPSTPTDGYVLTYNSSTGLWGAEAPSGGGGGAAAIPAYDNGVTYTVGQQVIFSNRFWYMSTSVGGAGYDPIGYPSYWTEISAGGGSGGLSINDLANGATSTLNTTQPETGYALTFDGTDLVWANVTASHLPLSGGTMTGAINFGTGGQNIDVGTFDSGRYGSNGISLKCAVGFELNWQAGWLTGNQFLGTPSIVPIYIDSGAGSTLKVWEGTTSTGVTISHTGITFPDSTTQTTAAIADAPSDGTQYVRQNGSWQANSGFTLSDAPMDGNYYVRMGSVGWSQIGTGTDAIATQNYVTSQGYATTSDVSTAVSTAVSGLVTANNARLQAMVDSIRTVCNDASYGFDGSGYLYIDLLTGSLNLPVSTSQFSSSGKWFGSKSSGTIYSAMTVSLSGGVVRITFQQVSGWDTGTGLFYTEDGGTTWVESTLKFA